MKNFLRLAGPFGHGRVALLEPPAALGWMI
jgi:hypothetical protein